MGNAVKIKTRADCTELQAKFLAALESPEAMKQPRTERWRWCAKQAGYAEDVSIASIVAPIQHLIKEVAETILMRGAVEAAWTLAEAAGDGIIDAQTKDRINASKDILERTVPKKEPDSRKQAAPVAVLVLPTMQQHKLVETEEVLSVSTSQEG